MLREEIRRARQIDLPIAGGNGCTLADAIIINYQDDLDMYTVENIIQNYLNEKYCRDMHLQRQELLSKDGRIYDHFIFEVDYKYGRGEQLDLSSLFFDITEGWNRIYKDSKSHPTKPAK